MIPLDLDDPLLEGAAGAAAALELLGQGLEGGGLEGHAGDDRHRLAAAPLGLAPHPHDAVAGRGGLVRFADAGGGRLAAVGAEAAALGGVDEAGVALHGGSFRVGIFCVP